ncbi:MAG: O-antigen ligase family protein [Planctomycetes bacterium]|nr:O-antigen ligase family protein [Planctomycetota bacterium]
MHPIRGAIVAGGWILIAALLAAAPALEGGAPAWAWHLLAAGALGVAALLALRWLLIGEKIRFLRLPFALLALFISCVALQAVPLPQPAVETLSPRRMRLERESLEGVAALGGGPRAISLEPERTAGHAWKWLAYGLVMAATAAWVRRRRHARGLLAFLAFVAVVEAVAGMVREGGTFVNRNHFAGLLAMGFFCALGVGVDRAARLGVPRFPSWRARLAAAMDRPSFWKIAVAGGAAVLIGLGMVVSLSRGAVIAASLGLVLWLVVSRRSPVMGGAVVALAFAAVAAGIGPLRARLEGIDLGAQGGTSYAGLFRMAVEAFREYPLSGAGMGTYRAATASLWPREGASYYALFAHNDYLDVLAGTGVIGATLFGGTIATILWAGLRRAPRSPLAAGALCALVAHAAHANAGFNFQMPANALWFFALAGAALSPAFGRGRGVSSRPAALVLSGVVLLGGFGIARSWAAAREAEPIEELSRKLEAGEIREVSESAAAAARRTGRWVALARFERALGRRPDEALARAVAVEPASAVPLVERGWAAAAREETGPADRAFARARALAPAHPWVLEKALAYWLWRKNADEIAACAGPLLWSGLRKPQPLFEEIALALGSLDFLARLLPAPGHPARRRLEAELNRFLEARSR